MAKSESKKVQERLAEELRKIDRDEERSLAEERLSGELPWRDY